MERKILFITPDDLSTIIFAKSFQRDLNEKEYQLFTASPCKHYKEELLNAKLNHYEIKNFSRFYNIFKDIKFIIEIYKLIKKIRPDYVVTFTTKPNIYCPIVAKIMGVKKIIIAVRGLGRMFDQNKMIKRSFKNIFFEKLYKFSIFFSNHVWFTNIYDKNLFVEKKICKLDKIIQTKNAIDIDDFSEKNIDLNLKIKLQKKYDLNKDYKIVLMVARLIKEKGIFEFAEAARLLKNKCPNLKFILIAPKEEGGLDSNRLKNYEKNSNFKWIGFQKNVREFYSLCHLSVLPSYYSEGGYPRALLEAMSFSKPVITTDLPLCRGPVDNNKNGYLTKARNAEDLSFYIKKIFEDKSKYDFFCKNSRLKVEKEFNDKNVVKNIMSYLN